MHISEVSLDLLDNPLDKEPEIVTASRRLQSNPDGTVRQVDRRYAGNRSAHEVSEGDLAGFGDLVFVVT